MPSDERAAGAMPAPMAKRGRSSSSQLLSSLDHAAKRAERSDSHSSHPHAHPPLAWKIGESKASYFRRLLSAVDTASFRVSRAFDADGLYLYKRPVRCGGDTAALLAQGGSVFHHVVVYVHTQGQLRALEFGPANGMDVTADLTAEVVAGPVLVEAPEPPEPACLPMLHIQGPHHPLEAPHVREALAWAAARPYQALRNNCIAFADFAVRVLTGGSVRGAPLLFDALAGQVPPVDSPLLGLLAVATGLSWFGIADGSRLTAAYLADRAGRPLPPLPPPPPPPGTASTPAATSGPEQQAAAAQQEWGGEGGAPAAEQREQGQGWGAAGAPAATGLGLAARRPGAAVRAPEAEGEPGSSSGSEDTTVPRGLPLPLPARRGATGRRVTAQRCQRAG